MNQKSKNPAAKLEADKTQHNAINVSAGKSEEEKKRNMATLILSPEYAALRIINATDKTTTSEKHTDIQAIISQMREQAASANNGELRHAEAMLMNQATALQSLFAGMTEKAMNQQHMPNLEGFMRIALRAQSQCRATLETLAAIKNPPVIYARQANINHGNGNQQVNNGTPAADTSRTEKTINQQNELLEVQHGSETVDIRTTGKTIGKNPAMAAVG